VERGPCSVRRIAGLRTGWSLARLLGLCWCHGVCVFLCRRVLSCFRTFTNFRTSLHLSFFHASCVLHGNCLWLRQMHALLGLLGETLTLNPNTHPYTYLCFGLYFAWSYATKLTLILTYTLVVCLWLYERIQPFVKCCMLRA